MKHTLTKGQQSNYQISLTVAQEDLTTHKEKALKQFQKEMKEPGFRAGHVPLDIVEKKIRPEYLQVALFEEVIHAGTKEIIEKNGEIKFVGNIYDLNREEKGDNTIFTFKLDVYPEVEVKDDKWKKLKINAVDSEPTQEEIDQTLLNLQKQYASYEEAESIDSSSVFKISFIHTDKDAKEIDKGTAYLGKEEFEEFPVLEEMFIGKKKDETVAFDYDEKKLPPMLHNRNKEEKAVDSSYTITDVRTVTLPDFTEENIKKFFGSDDVTTKEQLLEKITGLIRDQKEESMLMQSVDSMLDDAAKSIQVIVPKTLVEEEMKTRMKSLEERMGGSEGVKKYFESVGEEERTKMMDEIKSAALASLEKFFILRKLTELLELKDVNWQQPLDVEKKLYALLSK